MRELVSVLMPAYNVEAFIEEAVRSIMEQSYRNLEIIIVDDCSTDNTYDILTRLAAEDNRIRLFRNEWNKKIVDTLNFGLQQASGEYIVRMDGDDVCDRERIEKQYQYLKAHHEIVLVGTDTQVINEQGEVLFRIRKCHDPYKMKTYCKYTSPVSHIWMTRRSLYTEIGPYRMPGVEDYDFLLRILSKGYLINNLNECLYGVRIRENNTLFTMGLKQHKAAGYAYHLYCYRRRHRCGNDLYTEAEFQKATHCCPWALYCFRQSSLYYVKAQNSWKKNKGAALFWLGMSTFWAPVYRIKALIASLAVRTLNR